MTARTWIVRAGDGDRVEDITGDALALDEGRVFIGRARAKRGDRVRVGDEVTVHRGGTARPSIAVLHHGGGILAVGKPAGVSTIPDQHDAAGSLLHLAAHAVSVSPAKLHPTSRLDRGVSGVVIFADSELARSRLKDARAAGDYLRRYVAVSANAPRERDGVWDAPIGRARDPKKRAARGRDAVDALTRYRAVQTMAGATLLALEPVTGRTHQIRVHASDAGVPLLGDRDYGGPRSLVLPSGKVIAFGRVALHCARVRVLGLDLSAPIPDELRTWWRELGGADDAWTSAM